jgi:hypothetical protein
MLDGIKKWNKTIDPAFASGCALIWLPSIPVPMSMRTSFSVNSPTSFLKFGSSGLSSYDSYDKITRRLAIGNAMRGRVPGLECDMP